MLPWVIPAAISAGSALAGYATRPKSPYRNIQFPEFNYGQRAEAAYRGIGEDVTRAGRAGQKSMAAQGLTDTGQTYETGRGLTEAGMGAYGDILARLADLNQQYELAKMQFNLQKAQGIAAEPDLWDYLGGGAQMFGSLYPMLNPQAFMPQFPQLQQQDEVPQVPPFAGGFPGFGQGFGQGGGQRFNALPQYRPPQPSWFNMFPGVY